MAKAQKIKKISSVLNFDNIQKANTDKITPEVKKNIESYIIRVTTSKVIQNKFKSLYFEYMTKTNQFKLKEYDFFRIILLYVTEKENIKKQNLGILDFVFKKGRRKEKEGDSSEKSLMNFGNYKDNTLDIYKNVLSFLANKNLNDREYFSTAYFFKIIVKDYIESNLKDLLEFNYER